jgi:phosphoribosylformimino-5-aminoimidazole carboxamide ribotide isomerase
VIVIPAIDLRDGACVQLVGGSYEKEALRLENPSDVARTWVQSGFRRLHVVDLDAATGRGDNSEVVRELLRDQPVPVQVGGGVRSPDDIRELREMGAEWIVVGTRALEDVGWLEDAAREHPGAIIAACDVRGRQLVTRGWSRTLPRNVTDAVEELSALPLGGFLVTAVHVEGQMRGTDLALMEDVVKATHLPVIGSGGISGMADLRELEELGVAAAVVGMALYTGALDPRVAAEEFAE